MQNSRKQATIIIFSNRYALAFTQSKGKPQYQCSQYNVKGTDYCSSHYIRYDELHDVVLHDIRRRAAAAETMSERLLDNLNKEATGILGRKNQQKTKKVSQMAARIEELDGIISKLYEDQVLGKISEEHYVTLYKKFCDEQKELTTEVNLLSQELVAQENQLDEATQFLKLLAKYKNLAFLSAPILNELISRIEVGAIQMIDGIKHREIRIQYRQYCFEYVTVEETFAQWDEAMWDQWRELEAAFDEKFKQEEAEMIAAGILPIQYVLSDVTQNNP